MAHDREQTTKGDRVSRDDTQEKDFRHMRQAAESTGQERGAMPDTEETEDLTPAQSNTRDPKPHPTDLNRSGPNRKIEQ